MLFFALLCAAALSLNNLSEAMLKYESKAGTDYMLTVDTTMETAITSMRAPIHRFAKDRLLDGIRQLYTPSEFIIGQSKLREQIIGLRHSYSGIKGMAVITSKYGLWDNVTETYDVDALHGALVEKLSARRLSVLSEADYAGLPWEARLGGAPALAVMIADPASGETIAVLLGMLDPDVLFSLEEGMELVITDRNLNKVWSSNNALNPELIGAARELTMGDSELHLRTLTTGRSIVTWRYSSATGLHYIWAKNVDNIPALSAIRLWTWGLMALCLVIGLLIVYIATTRLIAPLHRLNEAVRSAFDERGVSWERPRPSLLSVRTKLILYGGGGIALSLGLFIGMLYIASERYVREASEQAMRNTVKQAALCIDLQMEFNEWTSLDLALNEDVQESIMSSDRTQLMSVLEDYALWQDNIDSICLYNELGSLLFSTKNPSALLQEALTEHTKRLSDGADGKPVWTREEDSIDSRGVSMTRRVRNIYREADKFRAIGYVKLVLSDQLYERSYRPLLHSGENVVYVLDGEGRVISGSNLSPNELDETALADGLADGSAPLQMSLRREDWRLVAFLQSDELQRSSQRMVHNSLQVLFIAIATVLLVIASIAFRIIQPITALGAMVTERAGIEPERGDEIQELSRQFHLMFERLDALVEELSQRRIYEMELTRRKEEAEMIAYQAQINPHFLSNTLLSVNMLIQMGELTDAREMLRDLGRLFEMMILRGQNMIPLVQEAEYLSAYLSLQKKRFERMDFHVRIDPEAEQVLVPRMALQPLVENALYHGLELSDHQGKVIVRARRKGGAIVIYIYDNGKGMQKKQLDTLHTMLKEPRQPNRIGLWNVNERLGLYLGDRYEMTARSIPGKWTMFTIVILEEGMGDV